MKRTIIASLFATLLASSPSHAAPEPKKAPPVERPTTLAPSTGRLNEFQGDDISIVIRTLARQAAMSVVIDKSITGTVTMRLENKTPREALEIVAQSKDLLLEEHNGVFYVRPKNPPPVTAEAAKPEKSMDEALSEMVTPALTQLYDALLDYQARPETARKIAKAKKALYDALIAEDFTKEEALRIILTNQELSIPNGNK